MALIQLLGLEQGDRVLVAPAVHLRSRLIAGDFIDFKQMRLAKPWRGEPVITVDEVPPKIPASGYIRFSQSFAVPAALPGSVLTNFNGPVPYVRRDGNTFVVHEGWKPPYSRTVRIGSDLAARSAYVYATWADSLVEFNTDWSINVPDNTLVIVRIRNAYSDYRLEMTTDRSMVIVCSGRPYASY